MDKSFNDQELSDIMKEIEALEEDFTAADDKTASPVLEDLAEMDLEDSVPHSTSNVVTLASRRTSTTKTPNLSESAPSGGTTSMSFKVQGSLTLDLQFDIGGKVVSLEVTESGLSIEMEGGTKFSVPVTNSTSFKKAV
jgi:hypothetical protein